MKATLLSFLMGVSTVLSGGSANAEIEMMIRGKENPVHNYLRVSPNPTPALVEVYQTEELCYRHKGDCQKAAIDLTTPNSPGEIRSFYCEFDYHGCFPEYYRLKGVYLQKKKELLQSDESQPQ